MKKRGAICSSALLLAVSWGSTAVWGEDPAATDDAKGKASGTAAVSAAPPAPARSHFVKPGETLGTISKQHYGTTRRYRALYEANRDQIQDPNVLHPGQILILP